MKKNVLALSVALACLSMAGCSSFKVGAACYIPYGVSGACTATTFEPGYTPQVQPVPQQAQKSGI